MNIISAESIIKDLNLEKHPEGGWYRETYRSSETLMSGRGERSLATVIYFLLQSSDMSAFHRLTSDEFWYFHQGSSLDVHVISREGDYKLHKLGTAGLEGCLPQLLLPAGCWFAAECEEENSFSLVSCSVHPGFDFADFELAVKGELIKVYPEHGRIIERFCIRS